MVASEKRQLWRRSTSLTQSSPMPCPCGLVDRKGVNSFPAISGLMPGPSSSMSTDDGFVPVEMVIFPDACPMLSTEFLIILTIACSNNTTSTIAVAASSAGWKERVIPCGSSPSRNGSWRRRHSLRSRGEVTGAGILTTSAYDVMNRLRPMQRSLQLSIISCSSEPGAITVAKVSSIELTPPMVLFTSCAIRRITLP